MPTDEEPDCDDADQASLQMMTQDYHPIDSEGEIEYLNHLIFATKRKDRWKIQLYSKQRDHVFD